MVTNIKDWVVDSGATMHIYGNKSAFTSYTTVKEGDEQVFMGDSRSTLVIGKGKVLLKQIVLTKNDAFVGKGYCHQVLFMLNVYDIINNNASSSSSSSSYIVDSCDISHGRLGHELLIYEENG